MTDRRAAGSAEGPERPVAVADLGSNSFRLVVYRPPARAPVVLYNERVLVGLAATLRTAGRLQRRGRETALATVLRFHRLARAMQARPVRMVATAAIRDAADGPPFVEAVRARTGIAIDVMDARREARLAARGLMAGIPGADGIVGDMGGGSLELARVREGIVQADDSLAAGLLRLLDRSGHDAARAGRILDRELRTHDWLRDGRGRTFYAVGGAWRSVARALQGRTGHPLPIIHGYRLQREKLADHLADLIRLPARRLPPSVPGHRRRGLAVAAAALRAVVRTIRPAAVEFSSFGLREGILLDLLNPAAEAWRRSPILDASASLEAGHRPFVADAEILAGWIRPALTDAGFEHADDDFVRACARLADLAWSEHPDHRARYAFDRIALRPMLPLSQTTRIRMALVLHARYTGAAATGRIRSIAALIPDAQARGARIVGSALRLAMTLGGGTGSTLESCRMEWRAGILTLILPHDLDAPVVRVRLQRLAEALERRHRVVRT